MIEEVESMMAKGDWINAEVACAQFLQAQPSNVKLLAYMGLCKMRKNDFIGATPYFNQAFCLEPRFWEAGLKLAQCLDRQGKYVEGLKVAKSVEALRPGDATLQVLIKGLERQIPPERDPLAIQDHNIFSAND